MSNLTADQLAADILARQGKPTQRGEHTFTEARLTAKQANYLFGLCERDGYIQERTHRWRHYRAASSPACWQVTEAMNGSALLSQTAQGGQPTDEAADQADELLDIWDAMHLQGIHDKLMIIADQADALLEEYYAAARRVRWVPEVKEDEPRTLFEAVQRGVRARAR